MLDAVSFAEYRRRMPSRRSFLGRSALAAGLLAAPALPLLASAPIAQRPVPRSGESLPVVGLGTWRSFDHDPDDPEAERLAVAVQRFADLGGRVIDSSPMYGRSSHTLGELARRQGVAAQLFYASKVWTRGSASGRRQLALELTRFGRPRLDLMQVHNLSDVYTQLRVLRDAREEGLLRLIGASHYLSSAHAELERVMRAESLDAIQVNYSIIEPEAEARLLPAAGELGVAVLANRVFAEGGLFQRVRGHSVPDFAQEVGAATWAQYFLKWVLGNPHVTVALAGTGNPAHVADNLAAGQGHLPDAALRRRMAEHVRSL